MRNGGFDSLNEFLDTTFSRLKLRLNSLRSVHAILCVETRFYATCIDNEQQKVPFVHSFAESVIEHHGFERELRILKETVRRGLRLAVFERFGALEALFEINAIEFTVHNRDDYPSNVTAPDFD